MEVNVTIPILEIDGNDTADLKLSISSHWRKGEMVVIKLNQINPVTVDGHDLIKAIKKAMNL